VRRKNGSGDGEDGARDLGVSMETTKLFPNVDEHGFFVIDRSVDVESI
jgi:hypothetical protein